MCNPWLWFLLNKQNCQSSPTTAVTMLIMQGKFATGLPSILGAVLGHMCQAENFARASATHDSAFIPCFCFFLYLSHSVPCSCYSSLCLPPFVAFLFLPSPSLPPCQCPRLVWVQGQQRALHLSQFHIFAPVADILSPPGRFLSICLQHTEQWVESTFSAWLLQVEIRWWICFVLTVVPADVPDGEHR